MKSSTFTGLAAVLFGGAIVALFVAMYRGGSAVTLSTAAVLFAGTIVCWILAALAEPKGRS